MMNNRDVALAYYHAMGKKDLGGIAPYLDPAVTLMSPLGTLEGKDAVLTASKGFTDLFTSLTIRTVSSDGDHVFLAVDLDCPEPIGLFRTVVLLTCKNGLITRSELFYDARPLERMADGIFKKS